MKKLLALALGVAAVSTMAGVAFADDETLSSSASGVEKGKFTSDYPVMSRIVTLPFRVVTSGAGAAIGFVGGTFKGIGTGVQDSVQYAHDIGPAGNEGTSGPETAARGIMYVPALGLSSVLFVPKSVAENSIKGAWEFGNKGNEWWDRI